MQKGSSLTLQDHLYVTKEVLYSVVIPFHMFKPLATVYLRIYHIPEAVWVCLVCYVM